VVIEKACTSIQAAYPGQKINRYINCKYCPTGSLQQPEISN